MVTLNVWFIYKIYLGTRDNLFFHGLWRGMYNLCYPNCAWFGVEKLIFDFIGIILLFDLQIQDDRCFYL